MKRDTYCWSIGNTGSRFKDIGYKNEIILKELEAFLNENDTEDWSGNNELQARFFERLVDLKIVQESTTPDKDARLKTSALADFGLVDPKTRKLTEVGKKLREITDKQQYEGDNNLGISEDGYLYLAQLIKMQKAGTRPFAILSHFLLNFGYLSDDEFTYVMPTCFGSSDLRIADSFIRGFRLGNTDINKYLLDKMMSLPGYSNGASSFVSAKAIDLKTISTMVAGNKGSSYDKPVLGLYEAVNRLAKERTLESLDHLVSTVKQMNDNQRIPWQKYIGIRGSKRPTEVDLDRILALDLFSSTDELSIRLAFFKEFHLLRWKSTLEDYSDLNTRYLSVSDVIRHENERYTFIDTVVPVLGKGMRRLESKPLLGKKEYFAYIGGWRDLPNIDTQFDVSDEEIAEYLANKYHQQIDPANIESFIAGKREEEFISTINRRFPKETVLRLLDFFEERADSKIQKIITDQADVPTCYEYLLGIIWYRINPTVSRFANCFRLALDANFLPKSHAPGGGADLVFEYPTKGNVDRHCCLIEATLSTGDETRHMEWEPVARHLENQYRKSLNPFDYSILISPRQAKRTISTFKAMVDSYVMVYDDISNFSLRIGVLDHECLKKIVSEDVSYEKLFRIFNRAFLSDKTGNDWFENELKPNILKA